MNEPVIVTPPSNTKPKRPLGVWVFTIYSLVYDGIFPLTLAVLLFLQKDFELTATNTLIVGVSIVTSLGVIVSAYLTWKGNSKARIWFLILITLYNGLLVANSGYLFYTGQIEQNMIATITGRMVRGIIFPIVYWIYFSRELVKQFFQPAHQESV